jgi:ribosomal protein S12 methylthiotransferase
MKAIERNNKVHLVSLGCPRNWVDSEVMLGILLQAGYEVAQEATEADVLIVNTCGFLESARDEGSATVAGLMAQKKKSARMIVAGCMVQLKKEELDRYFPGVEYFLGSGDVEKVLQLVQSTEPHVEAVTNARSYLEAGEVPRVIATPKHYAYLKISEGCRKRCAYCSIPTIKGPLRSKSLEQVEKEFGALLKRGVQEVILIAQDLGDYGKDQGKGRQGLEELLGRLVLQEGNFWLRLLYLYPDEITDQIIELMRRDPRICRYVDLPIQHVNDVMLKAMRRTTNRAQIEAVIEKLRAALPGIAIRTSLIAGFPGETEEQHEELAQWLAQAQLDQVGVFAYSQEEGTAAGEMEGQLSQEVKEARRKRLMEIQYKVVQKRLKKLKGKTLQVLVDGPHPESNLLLVGHHAGQCPEIDGQVIICNPAAVKQRGQFVDVQITDVAGYDLVGEAIEVEAPRRKSSSLQLV